MIKIKDGNKKCSNCGLFKLHVIKEEKYYRMYECKECNARYNEPTKNNYNMMLEIIDLIKSQNKKIFFGYEIHDNKAYYLTQHARYGDTVIYLLRLNEKEWEIEIDLMKPDFKNIINILKSSSTIGDKD